MSAMIITRHVSEATSLIRSSFWCYIRSHLNAKLCLELCGHVKFRFDYYEECFKWDLMSSIESSTWLVINQPSRFISNIQCSRIRSVRILFLERYVRTLTYSILAYVERYVHCILVTVAFNFRPNRNASRP
jgi:hypothetical protein